MTTSNPAAPASHPDPIAELDAARARLYSAFEAVGFDADMSRSPGSVSDADVAALGAPVDSLPPDLVGRFVLKAGTTWGRPADVRRVVPRVLDLAADLALPVDRHLLWAKLRWAGWPGWPTYQVVTTRAFLVAEWRRLLCADPRPAHLGHRWLRDVTAATDDLTPFLDAWSGLLGPDQPLAHHRATTGHLVLLLTSSPLRPDLPGTVNQVLPGAPAAADQLGAWLGSDEVAGALARAADVLAGTSDSRRVRLAADRLARFRSRRSAEIERGLVADDARPG